MRKASGEDDVESHTCANGAFGFLYVRIYVM